MHYAGNRVQFGTQTVCYSRAGIYWVRTTPAAAKIHWWIWINKQWTYLPLNYRRFKLWKMSSITPSIVRVSGQDSFTEIHVDMVFLWMWAMLLFVFKASVGCYPQLTSGPWVCCVGQPQPCSLLYLTLVIMWAKSSRRWRAEAAATVHITSEAWIKGIRRTCLSILQIYSTQNMSEIQRHTVCTESIAYKMTEIMIDLEWIWDRIHELIYTEQKYKGNM